MNHKKNKEHCIYGINNVLSLISLQKKYTISSIYILNNSKASLLNEIKNNQDAINIIFLDKNTFRKKFNFKHNQGIVAFFKFNFLYSFNFEDKEEQNFCYLIIDRIHDPQNLGQIIRTCECAGVDGIILPEHESIHITDRVLQISQGAFLNIDIFVVPNLTKLILDLKKIGFWIIGIENSVKADKWHDIDYSKKIGIVFGSEGSGIRRLVKDSCDFLATIPMKGKVNSLNISAAVSAILFERNRQINLEN